MYGTKTSSCSPLRPKVEPAGSGSTTPTTVKRRSSVSSEAPIGSGGSSRLFTVASVMRHTGRALSSSTTPKGRPAVTDRRLMRCHAASMPVTAIDSAVSEPTVTSSLIVPTRVKDAMAGAATSRPSVSSGVKLMRSHGAFLSGPSSGCCG